MYKNLEPVWQEAKTAQQIIAFLKLATVLDSVCEIEYLTDIQDHWSTPRKLSSERLRIELYFLYQSELGMSAARASNFLGYSRDYWNIKKLYDDTIDIGVKFMEDFDQCINRFPY